MVKKIATLMAVLALGFIASSANALDFSGASGASVTITPTNVNGATPIVFNPSTQVNISGGTVNTGFCAMTGHQAVQGKEAGQNYGMASDSNIVFWQQAPATYTALTGETNSSAFPAASWFRF